MNSNQYTLALISFLDILGFKDLIERTTDITKIQGLLNRLTDITIIHPPIKHISSSWNFSDTVVRVREFQHPSIAKIKQLSAGIVPQNIFTTELYELCQIQADLIRQHKALLRGAVTVGEISTSIVKGEKKYLFGPGLIRAYDLERCVAKYPRIIIDPSLNEVMKEPIAALSKYPGLFAGKIDQQQNDQSRDIFIHPKPDGTFQQRSTEFGTTDLLRYDEKDNLYYTDYLGVSFKWQLSSEEWISTTFENHRNIIESNLQNAQQKEDKKGLLEKYQWLAEYHNASVDLVPREKSVPKKVSLKNC